MNRCRNCSHLDQSHAGLPDAEGRHYCLLGGCLCMNFESGFGETSKVR